MDQTPSSNKPETYGAYFATILQIVREQGMDAALEFIMFDLDEQTAKMIVAHIANAMYEWERTHLH